MKAWRVWKEVSHREEQHRKCGFKPLKMSNDASAWASPITSFQNGSEKKPKLVGLGIFSAGE